MDHRIQNQRALRAFNVVIDSPNTAQFIFGPFTPGTIVKNIVMATFVEGDVSVQEHSMFVAVFNQSPQDSDAAFAQGQQLVAGPVSFGSGLQGPPPFPINFELDLETTFFGVRITVVGAGTLLGSLWVDLLPPPATRFPE